MAGHAFVTAPKTKLVAMEPQAGNTTLTGSYVPFDRYQHVTCYVITDLSTTGTNFNISFDQAQDAAGTGAKTLGFDKAVYAALDGEGYTETTVNGNQHTTGAITAGRVYMVEFWASNLDADSGFDHIKLDLANCEAESNYAAFMIFDEAGYRGWDGNLKPVSSAGAGTWS